MWHPTSPWRTLVTLGALASVLVACIGGPSETPSPSRSSASLPPTPSQIAARTASPSVTPQATPDQAHVPILQAGAMAATSTAIRVRDLPGTQWGVTAVVPPGAVVQIVLGPIRTSAFGWYLVHDADAAKPSFTEGWVAAGFTPHAFIAADPSAKPPPNGPTFVAGYAGTRDGDFGPFRLEGNTALRWALALPIGKPAGSVCRFTGTLTPAGGKAVTFLQTSASDAPAPGTVQPSFFAQHPTLRGDLFLHVASDCSWAVSVVRLPL